MFIGTNNEQIEFKKCEKRIYVVPNWIWRVSKLLHRTDYESLDRSRYIVEV